MPFKMVLWCNGSTRDFGSLRDCSSQSRTTAIFFIDVLLLVKVVVLYLLYTFFKCFFRLNNLFFFSTACDKSLSLPLKQLGNALHTQI